MNAAAIASRAAATIRRNGAVVTFSVPTAAAYAPVSDGDLFDGDATLQALLSLAGVGGLVFDAHGALVVSASTAAVGGQTFSGSAALSDPAALAAAGALVFTGPVTLTDAGLIAAAGNNGTLINYTPGDALSFSSRASTATYNDASGVVQTASSGVMRDAHYISGVRSLLREPQATNRVLRSEDFANWTAIGTPTITSAAHTTSNISLDLIGDDDGASAEGYKRTVTYTGGNAAREFSVYLKKGTSAAASGCKLVVRDTTAAADRLNATITFDGSGVPSVAIATGTYVGNVGLIDGVYRIMFLTASITTANTNEAQVYPAGTVAETGNVYAGGVHSTDMSIVTSYIKTTTAAVSRSADRLGDNILGTTPEDFTLYYKHIDRIGGANLLTDCTCMQLGAQDATTNPRIWPFRTSATQGKTRCSHNNGSGTTTSSAGAEAIAAFGDVIEIRVTFVGATGVMQTGTSINGGAEVVASASGAAAPATWAGVALEFGAPTGSNDCAMAFTSVKYMRGIQTMAFCRAAA